MGRRERAIGMKKKLRLGRRFAKVYELLRAMRRLRGTPLDVFGYAHLREVERRLATDYERTISGAVQRLSPANHPIVVSLASLPDDVRGYDEVKLESVRVYETRAAELVREIDNPASKAA